MAVLSGGERSTRESTVARGARCAAAHGAAAADASRRAALAARADKRSGRESGVRGRGCVRREYTERACGCVSGDSARFGRSPRRRASERAAGARDASAPDSPSVPPRLAPRTRRLSAARALWDRMLGRYSWERARDFVFLEYIKKRKRKSTWSTWSAVINLSPHIQASRAGELRSAHPQRAG